MKRSRGPFSMHGARVTVLALIAITSSLSVLAEEQQNVVTLSQSIEAALANGPDVRLAKTNLAISQAQYGQAVAQNSLGLNGTTSANTSRPVAGAGIGGAYNPFSGGRSTLATDTAQAGLSLSQASSNPSTSVSVSANYTGIELNPSLNNVTTLSASASQTLWDGFKGGRALATVQEAGLSLQGQQAASDASTKTAIYAVKQAYYTLLSDQRQLRVYQDTLTQRQEELKRTQTLFEAQNATKIDVKQAQVNETTAELDLSLAQSTLNVDREKLSNLLGWPPDKVYAVADVPDQAPPALDVAGAIKTALDQRDDLKQLRLSRATSTVDLSLKQSQYSPTINATGSVSWLRQWANPTDFVDYSVGLNVSVPIVDAGLYSQQIRQAQLQNESWDIQAQKLAATIATDVKNAVYSLQDLISRARLAQDSLELAQDNYDLAQAQFESGVIATTDLLTASVNLTTAQVGLQKAKSNAQLGILALQNAMGY